MAVEVFVTNTPGGSPFTKRCPYADLGCMIPIDEWDTRNHIPSCPFNNGTVDVDAYFKALAEKEAINGNAHRLATREAEERKARFKKQAEEDYNKGLLSPSSPPQPKFNPPPNAPKLPLSRNLVIETKPYVPRKKSNPLMTLIIVLIILYFVWNFRFSLFYAPFFKMFPGLLRH